jgi:hypothetical protein
MLRGISMPRHFGKASTWKGLILKIWRRSKDRHWYFGSRWQICSTWTQYRANLKELKISQRDVAITTR